MTPQQRFDHLKTRWLKAHDKASNLRFQLKAQYGPYEFHWPKNKRDQAEQACRAEEKAAEALFTWLDTHSPRQWRTGAPAHWVCSELTFADAMTTARLSVTPPVAYGCYPADSIRFAAPLETTTPLTPETSYKV